MGKLSRQFVNLANWKQLALLWRTNLEVTSPPVFTYPRNAIDVIPLHSQHVSHAFSARANREVHAYYELLRNLKHLVIMWLNYFGETWAELRLQTRAKLGIFLWKSTKLQFSLAEYFVIRLIRYGQVHTKYSQPLDVTVNIYTFGPHNTSSRLLHVPPGGGEKEKNSDCTDAATAWFITKKECLLRGTSWTLHRLQLRYLSVLKSRSVAQARSHRTLPAQARVRFRKYMRDLWWIRWHSERLLRLSVSFHHAPRTRCSYKKDKRAKPGNLPKSKVVSEIGSIGEKKYSHVVFKGIKS